MKKNKYIYAGIGALAMFAALWAYSYYKMKKAPVTAGGTTPTSPTNTGTTVPKTDLVFSGPVFR